MQKIENRMQDTRYRIPDKKCKTSGIMDRASWIGHHGKKGFTIIELVITMVLIGIVAYIAADAMSTGFKAFFVTDNRKEALDQARIAMERMTREIRNLRDSSSVTTSSATQFCFTNLDGTLINFNYQSPNIRREEGGACTVGSGQVLSTNISSFTPGFEYIRSNGTTDATFSSVNTKRIRITFTATVSGESVQLQSEVWLRNL